MVRSRTPAGRTARDAHELARPSPRERAEVPSDPIMVWPEPAAADLGHLGALLGEVRARPDAEDARLVLADALLAAGDPRGELIALQLVARPDDRELDRIAQLLREHGKRWLGALRTVAYRARFERGFLARLELDGRWTASPEDWARHQVDPGLATVEDLVPGRAVGEIYARFVTSPAMAALRRIEVFDPPTLAALRETSAELVHVACPRWKRGRYLRELAGHVLPACERFPRLRSFAVHIDGVACVLRSPILERLTALTVAGGLVRGLALWSQLPRDVAARVALTIARSAMLEDCAVTRGAWSGSLTLVPAGEHVIARAVGAGMLGELAEHFAALPAAVRRIEVQGAGVPERLTRAAGRRGVELLVLPPVRRTGYVAARGR